MTLFFCRRLREAAQPRDHKVDVIDPLSYYMNIKSAALSIHYRGKRLKHYDAVIPRIGLLTTFYSTAVLRQFEMLGSYALNKSAVITRPRDKLHSLQLLARLGIDLPITGFADSPDDTGDLITMVGGAPLLVKMLKRTQGIGVVVAETRPAKVGDFRSRRSRGWWRFTPRWRGALTSPAGTSCAQSGDR